MNSITYYHAQKKPYQYSYIFPNMYIYTYIDINICRKKTTNIHIYKRIDNITYPLLVTVGKAEKKTFIQTLEYLLPMNQAHGNMQINTGGN